MKRRGTALVVLSLFVVTIVLLVLWWMTFRSTMTQKLGAGIIVPPEVGQQIGLLSQGIQRMREAVGEATTKSVPHATLSKDTAEVLEKKLRNAAEKVTSWIAYTDPTLSYRISYPSHWTRDAALSGETSFFVRDSAGAFLWITIPALAFDNDAPHPIKHFFSIDGNIPATRIDADGTTTATFFYKGNEGLLRIEYNSADAETYRPIVDRIIQSFTFQSP